MIVHGFREIIAHGKEYRMELLEDFLVASNLAGVAFGNAGTGMVHAMSYPLSGMYHVAHGEANYQFLTAVFAAFLAKMMECDEAVVYEKLQELLDQIISRKKLREYGMKEEEIHSFAVSVDASQQRLLNQSYVKPTIEQMEAVYRELY